ncbi:MAG: TolC family protein [Prevotella sp.]|nr:TolC family protein [Prevotella sp.]
MKIKFYLIIPLLFFCGTALAQRVLSLDECVQLALQNDKHLNMSVMKQSAAENMQKSARTSYLPKVDAIAGYELFSREISILNSNQKNTIGNIGNVVSSKLGTGVSSILNNLVSNNIITPEIAGQIGEKIGSETSSVAGEVNKIGGQFVDAFKTDTRQIWAGAVMLRQPIYMGGAISAANKIADINVEMSKNNTELMKQQAIYDVQNTYWLVVSLKQKQVLANSYCELVKKLNEDVHKMIEEGVATKADGLKVDVKVNEAEMQTVQVEDGLALAKMLLCQLCGLPMDSDISLADENTDDNMMYQLDNRHYDDIMQDSINTNNRPELRMLQNAVDLTKQTKKLFTAAYRPQVALTGGYMISNPNVFDGFHRKFGGTWNVGILLRIPVWNWFEGRYKSKASEALTQIATMELQEISEKIDLQIEQCRFKLNEAHKKYDMTRKNIESAEENLRCANVGFQEGVIDATDVMAAQTAWQQAKSQFIDAQIGRKIAYLNFLKAEGSL